jgi:hypothetical protein
MFRICLVIFRPDATARSGSASWGGRPVSVALPAYLPGRDMQAQGMTSGGTPNPGRMGPADGPAQRMRTAPAHLYILDEPISLHFDDVRELLGVFGRLVDSRNRSRKRCHDPLAGEQHPGPIAVALRRHNGRNDRPGGLRRPTMAVAGWPDHQPTSSAVSDRTGRVVVWTLAMGLADDAAWDG